MMKQALSKDELRERVRSVFLAIQVGDALGVPVETMTRQEILAATNGRGVTGYIKPAQTRIKDTANLPPGSTSDDWFLTKMVAESIIEAKGFNHISQAVWHVRAYETSTFGWGGTTKAAIEAMRLWIYGKPGGRAPEVPAPVLGPTKGLGNGVAMKIAPLALWHAIRQGAFETEPFLSDAINLGLMTHSNVDATIAAVALGSIIGYTFWNPMRDFEGYERTMPCLERTHEIIDAAAHRLSHVGESVFWTRLWAALRNSENALTGCNSLESVPFAIRTFFAHSCDIRAALVEAVNAGGDTDTIASMLGAMCAANLDPLECNTLPEEWVTGLTDQGREASELAERFVDAALE